MFNNASYRQYSVTGTTNFTFSPVAPTVRMQPAIKAWTGATVNQIEPDPGNDGIWFMAYKVTHGATGLWTYEYALYNQNLDRAIQAFSVPLPAGVNLENIGFHAPPQHPGWAHDGTVGDVGYSSTPWDVTQTADSISWNTETFAQNPNANAIRWGTLYNFRFVADRPPVTTTATVGFFKTGSPTSVEIQAPGRPNADTRTIANAKRTTNSNSNTYAQSYSDTNSHSHGNADAHTNARPDHTNGVRAQSAGQAHGGSHLERGDLDQH